MVLNQGRVCSPSTPWLPWKIFCRFYQVALVVKNLAANAGDIRDKGLIPGLGRSPGAEYGQPTPVFLPGESHGQRSLVGMGSQRVGYNWNDLAHVHYIFMGFPGDPVVKNMPGNTGDERGAGSIPGSGRSPGGGNGDPLQYSCLENSRDRGAWWAPVHGVGKSWTQVGN